MHILNAPQIYQEKLNRANAVPIRYRVLIYVKTSKITGAIGSRFQYDINEIEEQCFDVTKAVKNDKIVLSKTIPELPTVDGEATITQYSDLKLKLSKLHGDFMQMVGEGAGIRSIKGSKVVIEAVIEDAPNIPIYTGKIIDKPEENYEDVTFSVKTAMWDMFDKDLKTNLYGLAAYTFPNTFVVNESVNDYTAVTSPYQRLTFHHPTITFDEAGNSLFLCNASEPTAVDLLQVYTMGSISDVQLGKFTMKWLSGTVVQISTPVLGNINITHAPIVTTGVLDLYIPAQYQSIIGIWKISVYVQYISPFPSATMTEIKGKTIDFWFSYTVHGNPISIVLDLLIRTMTNNWYSTTPPAHDPNLMIDYAKFLHFEKTFDFITLYISEWNNENNVFFIKNSEKPIQAKRIIQKALDHLGCSLTYTPDGKVTINSNWFFYEDDLIWQLGSIHCGTKEMKFNSTHSIFSAKTYDKIEVLYGYNGMKQNYSETSIAYSDDYLTGLNSAGDKPATYTVSLPYYKKNLSLNIVSSIKSYLWRCIKLSDIRLKATVLPQFGLLLDVGDKFVADFRVSPILPNKELNIGKYFMIYGMNKAISKENEIECVQIPEPIIPAKWCESTWCIGAYWK